jgi:hypothetical protein
MENHGRRDDLFCGQGVQAETKAGQFVGGQIVDLNAQKNEFQISDNLLRADRQFIVKDSGKREEYPSGMRRDTTEGKPLYTLIPKELLKRYAEHLTKGAVKYGRENWKLANSQEELDRFRDSAFRHFMQWLGGERDEDHLAAVIFNMWAADYVEARLKNGR